MKGLAVTASSFSSKLLGGVAVVAVMVMLAWGAARANQAIAQSAFAAENDAAMSRMMDGMHIPSSGDVDQDFAAMMIAHHQGAIEMAQAELRYGSNEQLHRIAQEIVVEQQQEITAMHLALGNRVPPSASALPGGQLCHKAPRRISSASDIYNMD